MSGKWVCLADAPACPTDPEDEVRGKESERGRVRGKEKY